MRKILPAIFNKNQHEKTIKTVVKKISFLSTDSVPNRIIIMKGVNGGKYEQAIVKEDPGLVIKYDANAIGNTAMILIIPLDCCASCSEVKKVPIVAKIAA